MAPDRFQLPPFMALASRELAKALRIKECVPVKPAPPIKKPAQVKRDFRRSGVSIAAWAVEHGIHHQIVRDLLENKLKGHRGTAHHAAIKLGLKEKPADESANHTARLAA